jgi:hypothetical protein
MNVSLRLYNEIVYIPTSHDVGSFFFEGDPVSSVPVERTEQLRQAIMTAIGRGNPQITRDEARILIHRKDPPALKITGAKSWHALDRDTTGLWNITDRNGVYEIRVDEPMEPRGWHEDKTRRVSFPAATPLEEVIDRLIAMIQERARQ